jgi:hypothetical protein
LILAPESRPDYSSLTDKEKVKFKNELFLYLFFLLMSIGFWYLIALGKEQKAVIAYPIRYENLPKGKVLATDMPQKLKISVSGAGYSIIRHKFIAYFRQIPIWVSSYKFDSIKHQQHYEYLLYSRQFKELVLAQMNNELQITSISPDTLRFAFTSEVEKKVPVIPVFNLQYEKQFQLYGKIIVMPDSVLVSGPRILIDTLKCVYNQGIEMKKVKDSVIVETELQPIHKISFKPEKVWLIVPVQKFTELELNIPIEADNTPENIRVKTFPGYVNLSCIVSVADYNKIAPYMFRATVNYQQLLSSSAHKVKVNLVKSPSNVQDIRFSPKNVEYLIEK